MHHGNVTRNYCWYALDESVAVANTLPIQGNLSECPYLLFTGKKPTVTHFRVPFCMMYAKVYDPITKMANRAVRCIHLGRCRDQPGYKGLDPETGKVHVSVHCRFVESECPGLRLSKEGCTCGVTDCGLSRLMHFYAYLDTRTRAQSCAALH